MRLGASTRRGTVLIALIIALVIVQIAVVGVAVLGAREQDLSVRRLESAKAFYAAESASNIALREIAQYADDDGDTTIGSIASGVLASGVSINGGKAAAAVAVSGTTYTVTASGQFGIATHAHTMTVQRTGTTSRPGLYAEFYKLASAPSSLASVPWSSTPTWIGVVPNANTPSVSGAVRWPGGPSSMYGIRMRGKINVPTAGTWRCYTYSDDGSNLSINGTVVVNNDGLHGPATSSGNVTLAAGQADIDIKFFENGGSSVIIAYWSGPGVASQTVIPASVLSYTPLMNVAQLVGTSTVAFDGAFGTSLDGFDSRSGVYGGANILSSGITVATNSTTANTFTVKKTALSSDALVGVGGNAATVIQYTGTGSISGSKNAATAGVGIIYQATPTGMPASSGALTVSGTQTISSNTRYTSITMSSVGAVLNISGNIIIQCDGALTMSQNAAINIQPNSSLLLYIGGAISMANTSTINTNTGDPRSVRVYVTAAAKTVTLIDSSRFCGYIFNPGSSLTITGGATPAPEYFGVYHGTDISITGNALFHADACFGSVSGSSGGTTLLTWRQTN